MRTKILKSLFLWLFVPCFAGCTTTREQPLLTSLTPAPFTLEWREGPWIFSQMVTIQGNHATCILPVRDKQGVTQTYQRVTFDVPDAQIETLRQLLIQGGFSSLLEGYSAQTVDGTFLQATLTQGDYRKSVTCTNEFPPVIMRLQQYLFQTIVPQNMAAARVESMSQKEALNFWEHNGT